MTNRLAAVIWALTFQPVLFALAYVFTSIILMLPIMLLDGGSVPSFAREVGMIAGCAGAAIAFVHGVRWLAKGMPGYPCMVPLPPFNPMD